MYKLSIEELAFATGFLGGPSIAAGVLSSIYGRMSEEEIKGRLTAASHALIAHGLLNVESRNHSAKLDPGFAGIVQSIITSDHSIRCEKLVGEDRRILSFFISNEMIVSHRLSFDVISELESIKDSAAMNSSIVAFVGPPGNSGVSLKPLCEMPADVLLSLREYAAKNQKHAVLQTVSRYLPPEKAQQIAAGLSNVQEWGTILRIETSARTDDGSTSVTSNQEILYSKSKDHNMLLFYIDASDPDNVSAFSGGHVQLVHLLDLVTQSWTE